MKTKTENKKTYKISLDWCEVSRLRELAKRCSEKYENTLSTFCWAKDASALKTILGKIEKLGRNEYQADLTWEDAEALRGLEFTCAGQYHVYNGDLRWLYISHALRDVNQRTAAVGFDTFDEN